MFVCVCGSYSKQEGGGGGLVQTFLILSCVKRERKTPGGKMYKMISAVPCFLFLTLYSRKTRRNKKVF